MNRTRIIFIVIIVVALLIVGAAILFRTIGGQTGAALTVDQKGPIKVRVLTALSLIHISAPTRPY